MKDKEKWKTFPCRDCLIRKVCSEWCFNWPGFDAMNTHAKTHFTHPTCLSCGSKLDINRYAIQWCCNECLGNYVRADI